MRGEGAKEFLRELIPVFDAADRLRAKGWLIPAGAFVVALSTLILVRTSSVRFMNLLGVYLAMGGLALIYRLCGKRRPLGMIVVVMLAELLVLTTMLGAFIEVFRELPGIEPWLDSPWLLPRFVAHFIGAGMMEELLKMLPVLAILWAQTHSAVVDARRVGVSEPLDAIVYACAAATMFVIVETLGQYVPSWIAYTRDVSQGLTLATVRTAGNLTGHAAYSGYFGYFIGLGLLRPDKRRRYWLGGYLAASTLHALHNALHSVLQMGVVGLSFLFLLSAILNARKLSPTRSENFATVVRRVRDAEPATPTTGTATPTTGERRPTGVLRLLTGPHAGREVALVTTWTVIGRDASVAVIVPDARDTRVSRTHCRVRFDARRGAVEVEDLHSMNGTFLDDGAQLGPGQIGRVTDGRRFCLGEAGLALEVRIRSAVAGDDGAAALRA